MKLLHANDRAGEHADSWYAASCDQPEHRALDTDMHVDVCVVGGGYTGLAAAHELARRGHSVVVLEAHRVGWGASGRNGGHFGSGFNKDQRELESLLGRSRAHALWELAESSKLALLKVCADQEIDVQYRQGIICALHRARHLREAHDYCRFMAREYPNSALEPLDRTALRDCVASDDYHGGTIDRGAGHLHPLRLATAMAASAVEAGASIHEVSEVSRVDAAEQDRPIVLHTAGGRVRAEQVVLATNGYLDGLVDGVAEHVMPINNFLLATEPLGERARALLPGNHAVFDSRFVVNYFRLTPDGRLLFGGGENYGYRFPRDMAKRTRRAMLGIFPELSDARIDYAWGGTLAITPSRLPSVKKLTERVLFAGGYSGHGVVLAAACGRALAEAIDGDDARLKLLETMPVGRFPGGPGLRPALLATAMTCARLLDRI